MLHDLVAEVKSGIRVTDIDWKCMLIECDLEPHYVHVLHTDSESVVNAAEEMPSAKSAVAAAASVVATATASGMAVVATSPASASTRMINIKAESKVHRTLGLRGLVAAVDVKDRVGGGSLSPVYGYGLAELES